MPYRDPEKRKAYNREYCRAYHKQNRDRLVTAMRERNRVRYDNPDIREKLRAYAREYACKLRQEDPELVRAKSRAYRQRGGEALRVKCREQQRQNRARFPEKTIANWVKNEIHKATGLRFADIPTALVEAKVAQVLARRATKG